MSPVKPSNNSINSISQVQKSVHHISKTSKILLFLLVVTLFALPVSALFVYKQLGLSNSLPPIEETPLPTLTPQVTPVGFSFLPNSSPKITLNTPPESKTIPLRTHTFQTFNNCGPASLSMAMSYFDINVTQQTLGQSLRPYQNPQGDNDDKSVSLAEISLKAKEYGLISYHRPAGNLEMLKLFITYDIPVITRTWLNLEEDISHYRVVRGYNETRKEIIQDDSYQNKNLRFSYQEFLTLWQSFNYEFIVIASPDKQAVVEEILKRYSLLEEEDAWKESLKISETELQKDQDNYYAKFNSSIALYRLGRHTEAVKAFESSKDSLPRRMLWYQLEPILAYYHLGNYDQVLSMTDTILNNGNRAYSELHYLRGLIYQSKGQIDQANQSFALADQYNSSPYWRNNL